MSHTMTLYLMHGSSLRLSGFAGNRMCWEFQRADGVHRFDSQIQEMLERGSLKAAKCTLVRLIQSC